MSNTVEFILWCSQFQVIIAFVVQTQFEVLPTIILSLWLIIAMFGLLAATLRNRVFVIIVS
jgi:hypothetical protein